MNTILLLRPLWLCALILPIALYLYARRVGHAGPWSDILPKPMQETLRSLGHLRKGGRDSARFWLPLSLGFLILALTGPAILRPGTSSYRRLDPLILVLDLSPSITASESASVELKAAASQFLRHANGRPIGLMAYGADAYQISTPSSDGESLLGIIAAIGADTMPVVGSRPDIALAAVPATFGVAGGTGIGGADIVVISDGAAMQETAAEAAARLKSAGARVWGLFLEVNARDAPAPAPHAMAQLVKAGGGEMENAAKPLELLRKIHARAEIRLARDPQSSADFFDFGPWLLLLSMAFLLPLYRKESQ